MNYFRIKKQADFKKLFSKGKRLYSPSFTLLYIPSKKTRMGISVGKKHGKAFKRNKIKRLFREAFRTSVPLLKNTYSFIFIPKAEKEYSFHDLQTELSFLFQKESL